MANGEVSVLSEKLRESLFLIRKLKAELAATKEPIAIIGMGCRFPQANTPEAFWELLRDGVDAVTEIPKERWDIDAYYDPNPNAPNKMSTRYGAFLQDVDQFDPLFFGISPREASSIDPQHRLLLEVTWEALERAGIAPTQAPTRTGVFIGITEGDYANLPHHGPPTAYDASGNDFCFASGRLSHMLGLQGPNMVIDTACSSSLVALHQAVLSLRAGESELALAGGVHLHLDPEKTVLLSKMQALAPDGRCKTFSADADGFGRGEGCGVVVLKRLSDARRDGDNILAVIRGSAINHDGPSSGLTVPNKLAQEAVIQQALANGNVQPQEVSYIEAHGTGTALGDPLELSALGAVLGERSTPLIVGSVKTNIGHVEAASGMASLIKVVQSFQHDQIPPHLHFTAPNPNLDWDAWPITIPTEPMAWPTETRIGGISAFGLSGTNAHVLLEAPAKTDVAPSTGSGTGEEGELSSEPALHLLTLSARTPEALTALAERYVDFLANTPHSDAPHQLADICFTANTGRSHFKHRLSVAASEAAELREKLLAFTRGEPAAGLANGEASANKKPKTAFLFTGQGSQYVGMGRELYESQPVFRQALDRCDELLRPSLDRPLLELLYPADGQPSPLDETAYTQPALFAIEYALAQMWKSWGIEPDVVMGHSVGEYVAACVAGVFTLEDGLKLIAERGRLMQALPQDGEMVTVMASEEQVASVIEPHRHAISFAAINGPRSVVISGECEAIHACCTTLAEQGIKTKKLTVSHAFHSPLMEPMVDAFRQVAQQVSYQAPQISLVSNLTGEPATDDVATPEYWVRHVLAPVRFMAGIECLHQRGVETFVEIGPKPILLGMGRLCLPDGAQTWLPSLHSDSALAQVLATLSALYVQGATVDWTGFYTAGALSPSRVVLPTYPFQRQSYWLNGGVNGKPVAAPVTKEAGLGAFFNKMIRSPLRQEILFETVLSADLFPYLADHQVYGEVVVPGACHISLILSAAGPLFGHTACELEDIIFPEALVLPQGGPRTVQLVLNLEHDNRESASLQVISFPVQTEQEGFRALTPTLHAVGRIRAHPTSGKPAPRAISDLLSRFETKMDSAEIYDLMEKQAIVLGPTFRWIDTIWQGEDAGGDAGPEEVVCLLKVPALLEGVDAYELHPCMIDSGFQRVGTTGEFYDEEGAWIPFAMKQVRLYARAAGSSFYCHARKAKKHTWDVTILDATGEVIAEISAFETRRATSDAFKAESTWQDWLLEMSWQEEERTARSPDYLPSPAAMATKLASQSRALSTQPDLVAHHALFEELDALSLRYVVDAFAKLGVSFQPGAEWQTDGLAQQLGVVPQQHRLFNRLLTMLEEAGVLCRSGQVWQVRQAPTSSSTNGHIADSYETTMLLRCAEQLAEVLQGTIDPLELLFPGGDTSLATQLYKNSPQSKVSGTSVQNAVHAVLDALPAGRAIRILEIGAGTGGTTSYLVPILPAEQTEYVFTDISPLFLAQAEEKFGSYPFIRFAQLNIENDPVAQGFGGQHYDLIVAANVLHATRDLSQTLDHALQLLAPSGALLLVEETARYRWLDLTFGLLDGWWRFTDLDVRPDHPLLSLDQWQQLLHQRGFQEALPLIDGTSEQVIMAQAKSPHMGKWLIFADPAGASDGDPHGYSVGQQLATQIEQQGGEPILVFPQTDTGQRPATSSEQRCIDPTSKSDYQRLLADVGPLNGIVHMSSLHDTSDVTQIVQTSTISTLYLVQALLEEGHPPALWLVTEGSQVGASASDEEHAGLFSSPLWGMGKVIALEHPELNVALVDLDPNANGANARFLFEEIATSKPAEQIAFHDNRRHVARLEQYTPPAPLGPFRLAVAERGNLDSLHLEPAERPQPGAGEIEIRVHATSMNFRDVLYALGMVDIGPLGEECVGEVTAVGEGVTTFAVGDAVAAFTTIDCFTQYVITKEIMAVPLPRGVSYVDAATIPGVYLTAYYSLHHIAQIKPHERVLIHAAAGGVGQAAIQLAKLAGAEIFATASEPKWEFLRSQGIKHIYNSRTLEFADEILADTNGAGVDIVLNSLTGDGFVEKGLSVLAPNGRFLEIAKRNVWSSEQIAQVKPDVSYSLIHVDQEKEAALNQSILRKVMHLVETGQIQPLPRQVFPIQDAVGAFRHMQQAKHIGKVVVTQSVVAEQEVRFRADGAYLITGGLGGLGLLVAEWMVERGARHLVLVSRSQPSAAVKSQLAALEESGATIALAQADVSQKEQVARVLAEIQSGDAFAGKQIPLKGIIHSAGVLDDRALINQTEESMQRVMAPKVQGAWHLHTLTANERLDFFVLFSSATSLTGTAGQANHAAANAFLDSLAHYRQAQGLPALSINWGAWSEIGAAAERLSKMKLDGQSTIGPQQGLQIFGELLATASAQVGVMPISEWSAFRQGFPQETPMLRLLEEQWAAAQQKTPAGSRQLTEEPRTDEENFVDRIATLSVHQAQELLWTEVQKQISLVLGLGASQHIDPEQGLFDMGLDSLMAIELRSKLQSRLGTSLPATLVFDYPSVQNLFDYLAYEVLDLREPEEEPEEETEMIGEMGEATEKESFITGKSFVEERVKSRTVGDLESLSEGDLEALLMQKTAAIQRRKRA